MSEITVQPHEAADHGECPDCGAVTRTVWGFASRGDQPWAVYYARWTIGHLERGARILVSIGGWGEGEDEADRRAFAALCRKQGDKPTFRFVDAGEVEWSEQAFLGRKLTREEALADPLRPDAFRLFDGVVFDDERVRGFLVHGGHAAQDARTLSQRAETRVQAGDDPGAVHDATRAIGLDPRLDDPWFVRGWARGRDGDLTRGSADLRRYLERAPSGRYAERARKILATWEKEGAGEAPS